MGQILKESDIIIYNDSNSEHYPVISDSTEYNNMLLKP